MYLSLDWLKDYVDIPRSITPEELGSRLTMHTVEIDSVKKQAEKFDKIVVGEILETKKHPNADKLQLAVVDVKTEKLKIVCGASNIKPGQKVPVALVGAILSNGMEIKPVEIRGIASRGMLCAEDEIGLGDDHSGILILEEKAKPGQKLADYLNIKDVVFEVDNKSITHRGDLWSHYGMARDIAAFLDVKMTVNFGKIAASQIKIDSEKLDLDIKIEDFKLCPRYMGIIASGIKIESSPKWLQERLIAVGARPINNIVDITNYIMLETGQPMHAFDKKMVDKIIVRPARKGESIETLDGEKRELDENILVIADSQKAIAVAGVMGGYSSEISNSTDTIIIESANFDFISIRKASAKLGLRTDASMRFEKALDPNLCEIAMVRAVELIKKLCPQARIASALVDEKKYKLNQGPIKINIEWLGKIIGQDIDRDKIIKILTRLGFYVKQAGSDLDVVVPTWRAARDISIKEDLAEEVARIYGYDNLEIKMPEVKMRVLKKDEDRIFTRKIKNILACGPAMAEVYSYSFVGEDQLKKLGLDFTKHIKMANPASKQMTLLRQNLAPNLINAVKVNQTRFDEFGLFEIGSVYLAEMEGESDKDKETQDKLPYQEKRLGIVIAGNNQVDYFKKLKGAVEYLLNQFNMEAAWEELAAAPAWAEFSQSAKLKIGKRMLGIISVLDKKTAQRMGIKKTVVLAEINLKVFLELIALASFKKYKPIEKYPPVVRDLAFVINEKILYNDIKAEILKYHEYIKSAELFDVYADEKLGKDKKNMAFHIICQTDRTFKAREIDKIQEGLIKKLEEKFEAKIRDF
ncbi:MAG: phenylalanine--tRNA ligase subunit beta [Patescibacteria group bacterium]|nr:phenylalanine--tRNA ligase subunit beta [Patescibacteria group bacterium]